MAGAVGNYSDGETIHGGDLNADLTSLLGNDARLFLDIFAGWNILVSGFALTAGSGMTVNIASGLAYANGIRLNMTSGSVTLATGNTQPRYDVIWVQAGKTAGINPTTSNPTQSDSGTYGVQAGTPGSSPTVPTLGDQTKVQVGTVLVPANATTASGCTLNSQATAPNAQGPVKTMIDVLTHIAASHATTVVHGFQATTAGGTGANELAQTDANGAVGRALNLNLGNGNFAGGGGPGGTVPNAVAVTDTHGNVGGANGVWDGTALRTLHPYADGSHVGGEIPQYNIDGRVEDSERLQGLVTGSASGQIPVLDGNGAVAKAEGLVIAGTSRKFTGGVSGPITTGTNVDVPWSITMDDGSFTPRVVVATVHGGSNSHEQTATTTAVGAGTASGFVHTNGNGGDTIFVHAIGYL